MKDQFHDWFSHVFVINLNRRIDRWAETVEELSKSGIEATRIERFPGVEHPGGGHPGCTQAHRNLLRKVAEGPWERVLVFEDDIAAITSKALWDAGHRPGTKVWDMFHSINNGEGNIVERFNLLGQYMPMNWDVLYLGAGYAEAPISRYSAHCLRVGRMLTTSSYGITKPFAAIWTERVNVMCHSWKKGYREIDAIFGDMAHASDYYCIQPRLFYQRAIHSDITGQTNSYLDSMTNPYHEHLV